MTKFVFLVIKLVLFETYASAKSNSLDEMFKKENINFADSKVERKKEYSFGKLDGHSSQLGHIAIAGSLYKTLTDSIIQKRFLIQLP